MPRFDTFSCWIQVDGLPLPEYKVEFTPDGEGITCWIPSVAGKAFQIYFSDSERVLTTSTTIIVDGQHCGGQAIFSRYDSPYYPGVVVQSGAAVSEMTVRPFIFSQCMLVDDDYYLDRPSNVGQISVAIDEVRIHGFTQSKSFALSPPVVHERAKKGIVHGVQLGPQLIERRATVRSTPVRRITTFIFNYRPLDFLLAQEVVPLATKPVQDASRRLEVRRSMTFDHEEQTEPNAKVSVKQEPCDDIVDWAA